MVFLWRVQTGEGSKARLVCWGGPWNGAGLSQDTFLPLSFSQPPLGSVEGVTVSWQGQAGMAVTFLQSSALVKSQIVNPSWWELSKTKHGAGRRGRR